MQKFTFCIFWRWPLSGFGWKITATELVRTCFSSELKVNQWPFLKWLLNFRGHTTLLHYLRQQTSRPLFTKMILHLALGTGQVPLDFGTSSMTPVIWCSTVHPHAETGLRNEKTDYSPRATTKIQYRYLAVSCWVDLHYTRPSKAKYFRLHWRNQKSARKTIPRILTDTYLFQLDSYMTPGLVDLGSYYFPFTLISIELQFPRKK